MKNKLFVKKLISFAGLPLASALLAGCATAVSDKSIASRVVDTKDDKNYEVGGQTITTPVGSTMIRRQKYTYTITEHPAVLASNDFEIAHIDAFAFPDERHKFKKNTILNTAKITYKKKNII